MSIKPDTPYPPKHPIEVNPWKEHVIENEPTHEEPREIHSPGDIPSEHDTPLHDPTDEEEGTF